MIINFVVLLIFLSDFIDFVELIPPFKIFRLGTEFVSIITAFISLIYYAINKHISIPRKYLVVGITIAIFMICNMTINSVPAGAILGGLRRYLIFIPFFIFPLFYHFNESEIVSRIRFVFWLTILQTPISIIQKLFLHPNIDSGDVVRGTMKSSGSLTLYLSCFIALLISFYIYKKIGLRVFLLSLFIVFIPMTINETKGALLLLPLAILIPVMISKSGTGVIKKVVIVSTLMISVMTFLITFYNYFWANSTDKGLQYFLQKRASGYLYKEIGPDDDRREGGRLDTIKWAFDELSSDKIGLFIGLGVGNVAPSGYRLTYGKYTKKYANYNVDHTTISHLLWETGISGIMIFFCAGVMILRDSIVLNRIGNDIDRVISSGWIAVVSIMLLSSVYKNVLIQNCFGALFFFISGYIVSRSVDPKAN